MFEVAARTAGADKWPRQPSYARVICDVPVLNRGSPSFVPRSTASMWCPNPTSTRRRGSPPTQWVIWSHSEDRTQREIAVAADQIGELDRAARPTRHGPVGSVATPGWSFRRSGISIVDGRVWLHCRFAPHDARSRRPLFRGECKPSTVVFIRSLVIPVVLFPPSGALTVDAELVDPRRTARRGTTPAAGRDTRSDRP